MVQRGKKRVDEVNESSALLLIFSTPLTRVVVSRLISSTPLTRVLTHDEDEGTNESKVIKSVEGYGGTS
jgi:hypothetical protein